MKGNYTVKGSNTLYMVWGIITAVFAGFYLIWNIVTIVLVCVGGGLTSQLSLGLVSDKIGGVVIIAVLVVLIKVAVGLTIRIITARNLIKKYFNSPGTLIVMAVMYFLIALINLVSSILFGAAGDYGVVGLLMYLFLTLWSVATGVFLILKYNHAIPAHSSEAGDNGSPVNDWGGASPVFPDSGSAREDEIHVMNAERYYVEGIFGDYKGKRYELKLGQECRIGRGKDCDVQLFHSKVSRFHCMVKAVGGNEFEITNFSSNGTFYDNQRLPNGIPVKVKSGTMLALGDADTVITVNTKRSQ